MQDLWRMKADTEVIGVSSINTDVPGFEVFKIRMNGEVHRSVAGVNRSVFSTCWIRRVRA